MVYNADMTYDTKGHAHFPSFSMPLTVLDAPTLPPRGSYGITLVHAGSLLVESRTCPDGRDVKSADASPATLTASIPGNAALFCSDSHSISRLEAATPSTRATSLVFRLEAVNTNILPAAERGDTIDGATRFIFRSVLETGPGGFDRRSLSPCTALAAERLVADLRRELIEEQGPYWPCVSRSYFLELLILLERDRYDPGFPNAPKAMPDSSLKRIVEYLNSSYAEPITLDGLAARFGTNRTTLNKRFRAAFGLSAISYVTAIRMDVASSLLQNTLLSVKEISARSGFSDEGYFSKTFRKKKGLNPLAYRGQFPNPYGRHEDGSPD